VPDTSPALAVAALAFAVARSIRDVGDHRDDAASAARIRIAWSWATVRGITTIVGLMAASQAIFVVFASWLEDDFGWSTAVIVAVSFGLGAVELAASSSVARFTDELGPAAAIRLGAFVIVAGALVMPFVGSAWPIGVVALAVYIGGFEFGVVSAIPFIQSLQPNASGQVMGIGFGCGTVARAACSVPAARLYELHGIGGAALLGAGGALLTVAAVGVRRSRP
jgi:predicted MFS family arabinose efflux permease